MIFDKTEKKSTYLQFITKNKRNEKYHSNVITFLFVFSGKNGIPSLEN